MPPPRKLDPGTMIAGKYRVLERLGGGGMGDVFRAEHTLAGRVVAMKLLREDWARDDALTRRFFQEAQAVNKIRHPNIVDVLDAGFSDHGPYVAMECLEGASFAAALARAGRLPQEAAIAAMLPILDALEAAHARGIVHRDLKPENLYLADFGRSIRPKILDFGIAKVMDAGEAASRTRTGLVFGTPDYLSPEQASGEPLVDGRSDVFAAGIVLFELLTGERPFSASTMVATAYRIAHEPAPRLAERGVVCDPRVQEALDRALAKRPDERFATAKELGAALAPLAPDEDARERTLRALVDAAIAAQPTQAAPRLEAARAAVHADLLARTPSSPEVEARDPTLPSGRAPSPAAPERTPSWPARTPSTGPRREASSSGRRRVPKWLLEDGPAAPASDRPPERARTARPLPEFVRGRCKARGALPRALAQWVERARGAEGLARVLAALPEEIAEPFRRDAWNPILWYGLEPIDAFLEGATTTLFDGDAAAWRKLAKRCFDLGLGPVLRPTEHLAAPDRLLKRAPHGWSRILDFGALEVTVAASGGRAALRVGDFDAASAALRNVHVGTMEGLVAACGVAEISARVVAGESSFARELEYELAWRAK